jgi:hypothetical protein
MNFLASLNVLVLVAVVHALPAPSDFAKSPGSLDLSSWNDTTCSTWWNGVALETRADIQLGLLDIRLAAGLKDEWRSDSETTGTRKGRDVMVAYIEKQIELKDDYAKVFLQVINKQALHCSKLGLSPKFPTCKITDQATRLNLDGLKEQLDFWKSNEKIQPKPFVQVVPQHLRVGRDKNGHNWGGRALSRDEVAMGKTGHHDTLMVEVEEENLEGMSSGMQRNDASYKDFQFVLD